MKSEILSEYEKQLLNQRSIIETVIGCLNYQIWYNRYRFIINAVRHLISALAAYPIEPLKIFAIKLLQD